MNDALVQNRRLGKTEKGLPTKAGSASFNRCLSQEPCKPQRAEKIPQGRTRNLRCSRFVAHRAGRLDQTVGIPLRRAGIRPGMNLQPLFFQGKEEKC